MYNEQEYHDVMTRWGAFRLDEGAYQDFLAGKLWISWDPSRPKTAAPAKPDEDTGLTVTAAALTLREKAAHGAYALFRAAFPELPVSIPYRKRMQNLTIDELPLSVRASNCLMRAGADTFGRLNCLIEGETGLKKVRNLGQKSEQEILQCFFNACYAHMTQREAAEFWQASLEHAQSYQHQKAQAAAERIYPSAADF